MSEQQIDITTSGVSFVDILFALVVGQVLEPIGRWATDPHTNPIPAQVGFNLGVALTITLTSWIGYHASTNRPRFHLKFFNLELWKFNLDILMVIDYFVLSTIAVRPMGAARPIAFLVTAAFVLYLLWDLVGAWEKHDPAGGTNEYKSAWDKAFCDTNRPDVHEPWTPTNYLRIVVTLVALLCAIVITVVTYVNTKARPLTPTGAIIVDLMLILLLVGFRFGKDTVG